ncbi:virulence factor MviN [Flagellimonas hymeniacidonis]|uniref:Virulence factor MviN n=1 Tax=Flagellimonas hymeniacidonis TaxID=2603628 RepID=A0A5C8V4P9_9FLAO|nr:lipid II flippase MurJ [Flagellimonas hymeniacidonis]TXN35972.1 virulence factor MviN [Flagellimonas hymeniacidonis]
MDYLKNPVSRNIILIGVLTMFAKGFGFFKETIIASTYGLSEILDTFYIAVLIPNFINNVFLSALGSVFIPNYVRESKISKNLGPFQANGFVITAGISLIFIVISVLVTDVYVEHFFTGHTDIYYQLIKTQFYYISPCILLWGISSLISKLLNLNDEFTIPVISGVLIPLSILSAIFIWRDSSPEIALAVGTLVGSFLQLSVLLMIASRKKILVLGVPNFKSKNVKLMFAQLPAKVSSGFLTGLLPVTDQFFAAQLAIGSIAALNFGLKVPALLTTIAIVAINSVLLPFFSKLAVESEKKAFTALFKIIRHLFLISLTITIMFVAFSNSIVELLFERNSFTSENTEIVGKIQTIFLIYVPFTISGMVLVNFLTSINKNNFMALVSFIGATFNIILDIIFMKLYGVYGIAICTTCVVIIRFLILLKYTVKLNNRVNKE